MNDELTLEFTTDELYLLYSLYGPAIAFGIGEPYLGKFVEEIEAAQRAALDSLVARDLMRVSPDGETAIDEVLAKMIETCAKPDCTVIATTQFKGLDKQLRYLHLGREMLVEHTPLDETKHRLIPLPPDVANTRLASILHLDRQGAAQSGTITLNDEKLFQARDLVLQEKIDEALRDLESGGLEAAQAKHLIAALAEGISNSSVVIISNQHDPEQQNVDGFGLLESADGLWLMNLRRGEQTTQIEFVPSSVQQIQARLRNLLPAG